MAFLDQKERILDIVLTDKGRELLSKNQLTFTYYAFSDQGMDYSGSLSSSNSISSSMDNFVRRNLSLESTQMFQTVPPGSGGFVNDNFRVRHKDLRTFLYTNPSQDKTVLPEFVISVSETGSIVLDRKFFIDTLTFDRAPKTIVEKPVDVIVRATVPKQTFKKRVKTFVSNQRVEYFIERFFKK